MAKRTSAGAGGPEGTRRGSATPAPSADKASASRPPKLGRFERVSSSRFEVAEQELRTLFGRNVRQARHRAGLTQADVANIVDTDSAYIGTIERGDQNVTLSIVLRLAYASTPNLARCCLVRRPRITVWRHWFGLSVHSIAI